MPGPGMELIGEEEIQEVLDVLREGYLFRYGVSLGDYVDPRFKGKVLKLESEIAEMSNVRYAVAVNSGTSALLTGLMGLGIEPGDEVIVPGYTFIASLSSVVYAHAVPILAEIDQTFNLDPADVESKITPRTRAIMAVHMAGNPARLNELRAVADKHGLFLVEDCCQAFGACYKGRPIGSVGNIGCFSFNAYKTVTSGDGGMVITDDEETYKRCFAFHDQGHSPLRAGVELGKRPFVGLDFRYTELQAAVMLAQLRKLPFLLSKLRENKKHYKDMLSTLPGIEFREITDTEGEIATMLTVVLPTAEIAENIGRELGTQVVGKAGWHVYYNMEQILEQRGMAANACVFNNCVHYRERGGHVDYYRGMLPNTDALVARSLNISIGVSDPGLSSAYGVTINDGLPEVEQRAELFCRAASKYLM